MDTFVAALGFNWLIAGTDAHAKNFSLLLAGGQVRLAPLYDVTSSLPHDEFDIRKVKLAMKIGGEYRLKQIGLRQWEKFARKTQVNADALTARLVSMAKQLPDEVNAARKRAQEDGLKEVMVIERLAAQLIDRAAECQRLLGIA